MTTNSFAPGAVVRLKSGSPKMTVQSEDTAKRTVIASYFPDGDEPSGLTIQFVELFPESLELAQ